MNLTKQTIQELVKHYNNNKSIYSHIFGSHAAIVELKQLIAQQDDSFTLALFSFFQVLLRHKVGPHTAAYRLFEQALFKTTQDDTEFSKQSTTCLSQIEWCDTRLSSF